MERPDDIGERIAVKYRNVFRYIKTILLVAAIDRIYFLVLQSPMSYLT